MKNKKLATLPLLFIGSMAFNSIVMAEEVFPKEYGTDGTITFTAGEEPTLPLDPEKPDPTNPVDPVDPPGPGTGGSLSIDYGSKFKFGSQSISTIDKIYYAQPDELSDGSKKPTYVQVTDKRGTLDGWKLSVSQPYQFKTDNADKLEELVGAVLTFTKATAVSNVDDAYKPDNVLASFTLAPGMGSEIAMSAKQGTGAGTWIYRFGEDVAANKEAVQLSVPGKSVKLAKQYTTKLIWALENTPDNSMGN